MEAMQDHCTRLEKEINALQAASHRNANASPPPRIEHYTSTHPNEAFRAFPASPIGGGGGTGGALHGLASPVTVGDELQQIRDQFENKKRAGARAMEVPLLISTVCVYTSYIMCITYRKKSDRQTDNCIHTHA